MQSACNSCGLPSRVGNKVRLITIGVFASKKPDETCRKFYACQECEKKLSDGINEFVDKWAKQLAEIDRMIAEGEEE